LDKELAERSLREFVQQAWHIVEPKNVFLPNWHIDAICDHLQAVSEGKIKKLIINIPPRFMKSLCVCVFWPAWEWGPLNNPFSRWIFASYSEALSKRDSRKCRYIIKSPWYQRQWGDRFELMSDQDAKLRYDTNKMGYRIATSVGGVGTGEGGDRIVVDDPHSVLEALSDTKRMTAITWWDDTMTTRGDNPDSAMVIIMQRLNEGDLSGHLLAKNIGYEHLCLPFEYEGMNRCSTSLNFEDPRTEQNELLHPQRYSRKQADELKADMTPYAVAGQLQQRPVPLEGGMIKWDWFKRYMDLPSRHTYLETIQVWDTAQKSNELLHCPWVCGTWMIFYDGYYLVDVLRRWMNYPDGKKTVLEWAYRYNPSAVIIEDKSTGQSLIQEMPTYENVIDGRNIPFTWSIIPFEPEKDKVTRMYVVAPDIQAGKVFIPVHAPWMEKFENEMKNFPASNFMDQADMLSMFLRHQRTRMEHLGSKPESWSLKPVEDEYGDILQEGVHIPMGPNTRASARMDW